MSGSAMNTGRSAGEVELNIVPLVDLCCLLILFFILTAQISSANLADVRVPEITQSQATKISGDDEAKRIVVNVVSNIRPSATNKTAAELTPDERDESRDAKEYQIAGISYRFTDPVSAQDSLLKVFREQIRAAIQSDTIKDATEYSVEIRGDERVLAAYMNPILQATAEAGMNKISITALLEGKQ